MKAKDFKFRVWDNKTKKFLKNPLLAECKYGECERLEIEIFTGLMENSKEIYESDILRNIQVNFKVVHNKHYAIFEIIGLPKEKGYMPCVYPIFQRMEFAKNSEIMEISIYRGIELC